ncbi:MATE family efflux transporter [Arenibaculum sp.]|uniref:MATE family efflux transporter n=1 Tax=Arenibaculum sp. TaxID=2865862 RepID=UPI002E132CC0|nr:MATE family efflux transporter [Arenibaculum sp.]
MSTSAGKAGTDLTAGPIGRGLIGMAVPTLATSMLQSLQGSVNAMWVGRLLGADALAASYTVNIVLFLMSSLVFGVGVAAMILVGQSKGRGDLDEARRAMGGAVGLFAVVSTALAASAWVLAPLLLDVLGTPGPVKPLAVAYLRAVLVSTPAAFVLLLIMMGLRGAGDAVTPVWFMVALVVGDALLNPVFIQGWGPVPRLGIAGSGVATVVSTYVGLAAMLCTIYARDLSLRLRGRELLYLRPSLALSRTLAAKGLPIGMQMVVASTAALAMTGLVNAHGATAVAAFGAASQLWTYIQMPGTAVGAAVSAMAAQNIGAGRWDRVGEVARAGLLLGLAVTASLVVAALVAGHLAIGIFLPAGGPAATVAQHILLVTGWGFVLFSASTILSGVVRANGAVMAPLVIAAVSMLPVRLGFAALLQPHLGTDALWWSFPLGFAAALLLTGLYYRFGRWRASRIGPVRNPPPPGRADLAREPRDMKPGLS